MNVRLTIRGRQFNVRTDEDGTETFRMSSDTVATTDPNVPFVPQFYWNETSWSETRTNRYTGSTGYCQSGDVMVSGTCESTGNYGAGWYENTQSGQGWRCRRISSSSGSAVNSNNPFVVTSRVLCIDVP